MQLMNCWEDCVSCWTFCPPVFCYCNILMYCLVDSESWLPCATSSAGTLAANICQFGSVGHFSMCAFIFCCTGHEICYIKKKVIVLSLSFVSEALYPPHNSACVACICQFLPCFDTVGRVIWPVKTCPRCDHTPSPPIDSIWAMMFVWR